jgi:hypothetical protein
MNTTPLPSQARLKELLDYDPLTGGLVWKLRSAYNVYLSELPAGHRKPSGRWIIQIDNKQYEGKRLIWAWFTGVDPGAMVVIAKDHDPLNTCWKNLQLVSRAASYKPKVGRTLPKGVTKHRNKYMGFIGKKYLGIFATPEEAHQAHCKAATELHQESACLA